MQLNETESLAIQTSRTIRSVFRDKMNSSGIYDIVDDPSCRSFKISFTSHDYLGLRFNYENGFCEFVIVLSNGLTIPLEDGMRNYSEIKDWEAYLRSIMNKIELRIPDKFLKAKGWL